MLRSAADKGLDRFVWVVHSPDASAVDRRLALGDDLVVIGRDVDYVPGRIADPRMSRTHFRIAFDRRGGGHRLGDANSRNGVFRNGERCGAAILQSGDVLRAGNTLFVYAEEDGLSKLAQELTQLARSQLTALIHGETGSGKERIARALHSESGRNGQFVAVNCAALPRELIGAELFGHTRGAFSGAVQPRDGLFVTASGGTLFLDEIGDLPLDLQGVLLRVLQDRVVRPIGGDRAVSVDVRVVAATQADLRDAVEQGNFRSDLYARLAQLVVHVPPLRHRRQQILALARELAGGSIDIETDAAEALLRYDWPFNVRQLESVIAAFTALRSGKRLDLSYLTERHPELVPSNAPSKNANDEVGSPGESRRDMLERLLRKHKGNVTEAAKELGKPRAQVYRWLRGVGLEVDRFR